MVAPSAKQLKKEIFSGSSGQNRVLSYEKSSRNSPSNALSEEDEFMKKQEMRKEIHFKTQELEKVQNEVIQMTDNLEALRRTSRNGYSVMDRLNSRITELNSELKQLETEANSKDTLIKSQEDLKTSILTEISNTKMKIQSKISSPAGIVSFPSKPAETVRVPKPKLLKSNSANYIFDDDGENGSMMRLLPAIDETDEDIEARRHRRSINNFMKCLVILLGKDRVAAKTWKRCVFDHLRLHKPVSKKLPSVPRPPPAAQEAPVKLPTSTALPRAVTASSSSTRKDSFKKSVPADTHTANFFAQNSPYLRIQKIKNS
jgi:hypothetical protein